MDICIATVPSSLIRNPPLIPDAFKATPPMFKLKDPPLTATRSVFTTSSSFTVTVVLSK